MAKRIRVFTINAPNAATTNAILATPDDQLVRNVTGWLVVNAGAVAGVVVKLFKAGYDVADADAQAFSATQGPLPLDVSFPVGVQLTASVVNTSGAGQANVTIIIFYEAPGSLN